MLQKVSVIFYKIKDPLQTNRPRVSLRDCVMSGLAMFLLKYPTLLQFNDERVEDILADNLKTLYELESVPSDTYLRERLDVIHPTVIRPAFKSILSMLQRGKALEEYGYLGGYLLSLDGTGLFSSHEIHCDQCNVKNHSSKQRCDFRKEK